ncbi:MAG: response regulator [Alphaproteobacteria bacterium]|nr:response regulator [Alphaproteobacteria bacterium]
MPAPPLPPSYKPGPPRTSVSAKPARRVFICDDDLDFARELAEGLAANGFEARTLAGNRSATDIFDDFLPEVVLLDLYMPPPDGFEMINHIRNTSDLKRVPLVLMSGAGTGILEVASRFCIARNMSLAAAFQKQVNLEEMVRVCNIHVRP